MIKVKDGYAKLIGTTYNGSADRVLLSNGGDKAVSDFAAASALSNYVTLTTAQNISGIKTFTGGGIPIKLNSTGNEVGVQFLLSGAAKGWVGHTNTTGTYLYNYPSAKYIGVKDDGTPYYHNGAFRTLLHSGNYSSYALPLSGGELTGPLNIKCVSDRKLILNNTDGEKWSLISFQESGEEYGYLGTAGSSNLNWNGAVVLHSANYNSYAPKLDGTGASGTWGINISGTAANANTLDNIDSTGFLRKVTVANNAENDFNTFENMTLTGRGDPTTGASLKNAPWSGSGPAGGYGVLTYLWSSYGTQMAWGYNSNRIYIRKKYYTNSSSNWSSTWDSLALTSDLKNPTDYYWANVQISATSSDTTTPKFGLITSSGNSSDTGLNADGSQYRLFFGIGSGNVNRGIYDRTHEHWWIYRSDTTNTYIPYGNVGIGSTNPTQKLTVGGDILLNNNLYFTGVGTARIKYGSHTSTALGSYPLPSLGSYGIGIFVRPSGSTDEGGLIITEDTCMIFNSADSGWSFQIHNTDLSQRDFSGTNGDGTKSRVFGILDSGSYAWSRGGFQKNGSDDSYVLLGGGGHKAVSDFSMAHSHSYLPLAGGTMEAGAGISWPQGTSSTWDTYGLNTYQGLKILNTVGASSTNAPSNYAVGLSVSGYYGFCLAYYGGGNIWWLKGNSDTEWKTVIHSGNIGSQSVNYATSAGNADKLDDLHASSFYIQGRGAINAQVDLQTIPKDASGGWMVTNSGWTGMVAVLAQGHNASNRAIGFLFKGGQSSRVNLLTQVDNTWGDRGVIAYTSDIPTSLPADGGNADTVDGVHLEWSGSQAASSTTWLAGWTADGTKIKAVKQADLSVNYAASAGSVDWSNVTNRPTIPSVGNGTVTINQAGASKGSFTLNQSTAATINLTDSNYYHTPSYSSGLLIASGTGVNAMYVPNATSSQTGVVTTAAQTFGGAKTFSGAMTVNNTITFGKSDSYGIRTIANNYCKIGESDKAFYQAYVTQMYVNSLTPIGTGGSIGTASSRFAYGYFNNSVNAAGGFYEASDERLKNILKPVKVNLDDLSKLRKIYYLWKNRPEDGIQLGMIAQDIQRLYPELVSVDKETGYLSLAYDKLSVLALEAIDVLYNESKKLKERVDKLEKLLINKGIS